ncbi:ribosome rescue GTPase HflX [Lysobacter soyae]|uniref:GTPase HflX n=1 Tax=Lysobacter soyae TaxID=2764185 RepID=A0ABX8WL47_9GAMM|nr:ribosome rescue GTPase HflX [Lysobacter sp. CJ11]QYR52351.1 GTPase HflX [Lysobacter sp. CJ11]
MFERSRGGERALLIHPQRGSVSDDAVMLEFNELARSAGATVVAEGRARIDRPNPAVLIGSGKLDEFKAMADATDADLVLVNHALSPVQERNLEREFKRRVVDRTGLILDIFAQRAQSHEGKLQVELAQLKHMSTRLVRGWTHLERQRGGSIGLRGPGETQLETDRRLLQTRLEQLQRKLDKVEVQRGQLRRARVRSEMPRIALVGYTNAGKSTLFNALTGAQAYAADQLFATLDPTVRRVTIPSGQVILADTVGFVRDLPHELVAAFRSTLSEAREADLLLHVIDAADAERALRIEQVDEVLKDIGAGDIPQLLVYNKIDQIEGAEAGVQMSDTSRSSVWLSAQSGEGLEGLKRAIGEVLGARRITGAVTLAPQDGKLYARLHALDAIRHEAMDEHGHRVIDIDLDEVDARKLAAAGAEMLRPLLPLDEEDPI